MLNTAGCPTVPDLFVKCNKFSSDHYFSLKKKIKFIQYNI